MLGEGVDWIVRFERKADGKIYFFDRHASVNARMSSAMKMTRAVAVQFARAIRSQHPTLSAHAMRLVPTARGTRREEAE